MYVYCGEDDWNYLVDTNTEKVYEISIDENGEVYKYQKHQQNMQNFLRWHPYLEVYKETSEKPEWLKKNNSVTELI